MLVQWTVFLCRKHNSIYVGYQLSTSFPPNK